MFIGEFHHSLDTKGRIAIPARFRDELGDAVVINRHLDGCLAVYTVEGFQKKYEAWMQLNSNKAEVRKYVRAMTSQAFEAPFDNQGRILVPATLSKIAELGKDCVFIGAGDHLELWSEKRWNEYNSAMTDEEIEKISEEL